MWLPRSSACLAGAGGTQKILSTSSRTGAMRNLELWEKCQAAVEPVLAQTEVLVNMDSGTDDLAGLAREADYLCRGFEEIGGRAELLQSLPAGSGRHNVVARFSGEGAARILLLTHYDTVFPAGEAAARPFTRDGENAYGPGVADMQASIAMLLVGLPIFHALAGRPYAELVVFCNAEEESGSHGSRDHIRKLASEADMALNMELSGSEGDLITVSGRGMANGVLKITGQSAHSAAEPPAGVNAGLELAWQMLQLRDLSRPELRTAVNFTVGSFGSRPNVIPDHAEAIANIRVARPEEFARVEQEICQRIKNRLFSDSKVEFSMEQVFQPYGNTPEILALADRIRALAREDLGLELGYRHAIGSNDTSFSAERCPSLDGFGPGCVAMHSRDERLPIKSIAPRLYILLKTLGEICAGNLVPLKQMDNHKGCAHD